MSGYLNKFLTRATSMVHRVDSGEGIFTGIFTIPDPHRITCVTRVQPCLGAQGHASYVLLFSRSVVSSSFATPWTVARQAPLSMGFPRREYLSGLPFPSPGDSPHPGIEPVSPALAGRSHQ